MKKRSVILFNMRSRSLKIKVCKSNIIDPDKIIILYRSKKEKYKIIIAVKNKIKFSVLKIYRFLILLIF